MKTTFHKSYEMKWTIRSDEVRGSSTDKNLKLLSPLPVCVFITSFLPWGDVEFLGDYSGNAPLCFPAEAET